MNEYAIKSTTFDHSGARQRTPNFGTVQGDDFIRLTDAQGSSIRCNAGYLWVTFEDDVMDHVLYADQAMTIPNDGTTIIGGKGTYSLEKGPHMSMAS